MQFNFNTVMRGKHEENIFKCNGTPLEIYLVSIWRCIAWHGVINLVEHLAFHEGCQLWMLRCKLVLFIDFHLRLWTFSIYVSLDEVYYTGLTMLQLRQYAWVTYILVDFIKPSFGKTFVRHLFNIRSLRAE